MLQRPKEYEEMLNILASLWDEIVCYSIYSESPADVTKYFILQTDYIRPIEDSLKELITLKNENKLKVYTIEEWFEMTRDWSWSLESNEFIKIHLLNEYNSYVIQLCSVIEDMKKHPEFKDYI